MVDIIRRKSENQAPSIPSIFNDWEPFSGLRQLMRWGSSGFDPFREMIPVLQSAADLPSYIPAFEVKETKEGYSFKADIPGVKDDDLKITVSGNRLSITGKREEEKKQQDDKYYCYERSYGSFSRAFTLPDDADTEAIKADSKNGQLSVLVPKKAGQSAKEVKINQGEAKSDGEKAKQ
jgi:HSP20 family protein